MAAGRVAGEDDLRALLRDVWFVRLCQNHVGWHDDDLHALVKCHGL